MSAAEVLSVTGSVTVIVSAASLSGAFVAMSGSIWVILLSGVMGICAEHGSTRQTVLGSKAVPDVAMLM